MSDGLNYFEDLEFDVNNLDGACEKQHIINMRYYELLIEKQDEFNEEKRQTKIKEAEMKESFGFLWINYKSAKIGEKSPTDKVVEGMILCSSTYKEAQSIYFDQLKKQNDAEKKMNVLDAVVKSFQQRKNMIERRIDLYILGYNGQIRQNDSQEKVKESIYKKLDKRKNKNN